MKEGSWLDLKCLLLTGLVRRNISPNITPPPSQNHREALQTEDEHEPRRSRAKVKRNKNQGKFTLNFSLRRRPSCLPRCTLPLEHAWLHAWLQ